MANQRKVQAEIDKLLKKVQEGTEIYDEVYEKVQTAQSQLQKEKFEADLKKEIKKLQRHREQVKALIASPEVKDKKALEQTRRAIEVKMENFKVCERETKTKAFSKEGLAAGGKLDPLVAAKMQTCDWLRDSISDLEERIETIEFDIENEGGLKRKKGQVDEREERIIRCKYHVLRLEQLLRLVENGEFEPAEVDEIQDEVEAFVEGIKDESYQEENPEVYDTFDLPDVSVANYAANRGASSGSDSSDDEGSAAVAAKAAAATPKEDKKASAAAAAEAAADGGRVIEHKKKVEPAAAAPTTPVAVTAAPAAAAKAPAKQPSLPAATAAPAPAPVKAKEAPTMSAIVTKQPPPAVGATPLSPQQPAKPTAAAILTGKASAGAPASPLTAPAPAAPAKLPLAAVLAQQKAAAAAAAAAAHPPASPQTLQQNTARPSPSSLQQPQQPAAPAAGNTATSHGPQHLQGPPPAFDAHPPAQSASAAALSGGLEDDDLDAMNDDTFGDDTVPGDGSLADLAAMTQQREWQPPAAGGASSRQGVPMTPPSMGQRESSSLQPSAPPASPASLAGQQQPWSRQPSATVQPAPQSAPAPAAQPAAAAQQNAAAPAAATASGTTSDVAARANIIRMLDMSLRNLPHTSDCERLKPYAPPNPCKTPAHYPQVTHPAFSSPETFTKFSPDILFFIFYYQQTTYQQYLAAKELKRLAWRFHKKFSTWFQRHDKPKSSNEEQETGTYLYFDYERAWQTQIKNDFVFKYSFLEDELQ